MNKPVIKILDPKKGNPHQHEIKTVSREDFTNHSSLSKAKGICSNQKPIVPIRGPPIPMHLLPPSKTWPMFSAIPADNGRIMARNFDGLGK